MDLPEEQNKASEINHLVTSISKCLDEDFKIASLKKLSKIQKTTGKKVIF